MNSGTEGDTPPFMWCLQDNHPSIASVGGTGGAGERNESAMTETSSGLAETHGHCLEGQTPVREMP
jgi:hypothetical protein